MDLKEVFLFSIVGLYRFGALIAFMVSNKWSGYFPKNGSTSPSH